MFVSSSAPSPRRLPFIGHSWHYARDPLGFLTRAAQDCGDVVQLHFPGMPTYLLVDAADIEDVCIKQAKHFRKDRVIRQTLDALGGGLILAEGADWRRQRRIVQPMFHNAAIRGYGDTMVRMTRETASQWQTGAAFALDGELMRLTLLIAAEVLFGADMTDDVLEIKRAVDVYMELALGIGQTGIRIPMAIPTPGNIRARRARQRVDALVYRMIRELRVRPGERDDVLTRLLAARDQDGIPLSEERVRDEVLTLLLTGHETTALGTTYAMWLLARHPEVQQQVADEARRVLGDRPATAADVPSLPLAEAVSLEALRLYPPVWATGREAITDCRVAGIDVTRGTQIFFAQWVNHRHPRYFSKPLSFHPERWLGGLSGTLPKYAFFPFGGGQRTCVGASFSMMESVLMIATLLQHCALELVDRAPLDLEASVTLRPKQAILVRAHERHPTRATTGRNPRPRSEP